MSNDTTHCIYRIVCFVTGDCYIGQTKNFNQRRRAHLSTLGRGVHGNERLQRAYNKYGRSAFYFEELESNITLENINIREIHWIEITTKNHELYNMIPGGDACPGIARTKPTTWNGIEYLSLNEAIKASGHSPASMIKYVRIGCKCDNDIPNGKLNKSMEWNGIQYRSINSAAQANGVKWETMQGYFNLGYTCDNDVPETRKKPCIWNGIQYASVNGAALANNVSIGCMSTRLKKGLKSDEDVKNHFSMPHAHPVVIDGISFPSISSAARGTGKTYSAIVHMIKKKRI